MASTDNNSQKSAVQQIFESMEYGTVMESKDIALNWIKNQKFGFFIDGEIIHPEDRRTFGSFNFLHATVDDANHAISSAKTAFPKWKNLPGYQRAKFLYSIARNIQKQQQLITMLECVDTKRTIRDLKEIDIPNIVKCFYYYAGWAQMMDTEFTDKTPLGVVVIDIPQNLTIMHLVWALAPALASGNTVIVKPANPLSAFLLAEIAKYSEFPKGVMNIITVEPEIEEDDIRNYLITHNDVKKISFMGSVEQGQNIRQSVAGLGKRLSLDLGGKSAMIAFDSVDVDSLLEGVIDGAFYHSGEVPSSVSRLFIQETIFDTVISKLKDRMTSLYVGEGNNKLVDVNVTRQRDYISFIGGAESAHATIFQARNASQSSGNSFLPTLITDLDPELMISAEDELCPIIVAYPFRTVKESINLVNNSLYGLSASIWAENMSLALEVASNLKVGTVWINCHNVFDPTSPFGGCRQSGFGRHGGKEGFVEYLQPNWKLSISYNGSEKVEETRKSSGDAQPNIDLTYKLYIGGDHKRPESNSSRLILSSDGTEKTYVGDGSRKDIRNAVESAQKVQPSWAKKSAYNRAQILYYIGENLEKRRDEFIQKLKNFDSKNAEQEFDASVERIFYWAGTCDKFGGNVEETGPTYTTIQTNCAIGVIGIVCPNNFPLLAFISLVIPAIARGNTVIAVPSESYPLPALDFAQVLDTSDVPGGVINIISGNKNDLAASLSTHHDIQSVWYFGDYKGRRNVEGASADNLKRVWTEAEYGRKWLDINQGQGEEFSYHATQYKTIWMPVGDIYAN